MHHQAQEPNKNDDHNWLSRGSLPRVVFGYHVHVYFDSVVKHRAEALRTAMAQDLGVSPGRIHDALIGPHTMPMFSVNIEPGRIDEVTEWLKKNHGPLSVLIHPETGDVLGDHTVRAVWLGYQVPLRTDRL
jgi:DOPA 4,5-dioxygenase